MLVDKKNIIRFSDARGEFFEIPNLTKTKISQYSVSISKKNVIRGIHYQYQPAMGKQLVVLQGSILDCIVDLRKEQSTYGRHEVIKATTEQNSIIYIPPGHGHSFRCLEDNTILLYLQTTKYNKQSEGGIDPFDETLNICWGISKDQAILSEKDIIAEKFEDFSKKYIDWRLK
jgi:dTDP-4-dehydrorhamnose 3,5-epimerase